MRAVEVFGFWSKALRFLLLTSSFRTTTCWVSGAAGVLKTMVTGRFSCGVVSQQERNSAHASSAQDDILLEEIESCSAAEISAEELLNSNVASQFRILTCSATACSKKRRQLGLDEFHTFAALYARASETRVIVEETLSCLGRCKQAPCVAVQHEDYEGTVSLEGMTSVEFSDRVFQNIVDDYDAERVWSSVVDAIGIMAEQENEEEC